MYSLVANWGESPEQWEAIRSLKLLRAFMMSVLEALTSGETLLEAAPSSLCVPFTRLIEQQGITRMLFASLRRGDALVGILTACYRGQQTEFTATQKHISQGIAQLAVMALDNARLLEQAQEASRLKSDFLATMSHELRTPLSILLGYTQLLLDGEFGSLVAEQLTYLQKIDSNARQLHELVVALLDINRLEVGQLPVVTAFVCPEIVMKELRDEVPRSWKSHISACASKSSPICLRS